VTVLPAFADGAGDPSPMDYGEYFHSRLAANFEPA